MQLTGLLHGAPFMKHVDFPVTEVLGPTATEVEIQDLINRHKLIFIKPVFKGGVGKKGKAGLIGKAADLRTALAERERLFFVEHRHGAATAKANGVTFEASVPAEHEVYFSITDSTVFRAPTMTLTHMGGVDIEELDKKSIANVPFEALTGLKAFVVANALSDIGAPKEIISPLVQHLPKLWDLFHLYGMTTLEVNPIRMGIGRDGRLTPVACDFRGDFDRDDPRWHRLDLPGDASAPTPPPSSWRSISSAPIRVSRTSSSSTRTARSSRPPSVAAPIRWSPKCWARPRSSPPISAATRPTRR